MPKNPNGLTLALLAALALCLPAVARAQQQAAQPMLASAMNETDRQRDGLQGPVRRVRTETSKLVTKDGKPSEGPRALMETATYDMKGAKIDNAYFLGASGALTGREVYKYDERGNIVEMTLFNADGSVMSKEKYDYDFDAMGNWTKMQTSVAVIENGKMSFEPSEVTYRSIAYYLEDGVSKKLQPGQLAAAPASAPVTPAPTAAANANQSAALKQQPAPVRAQPSAPQRQAPAAAPGSALLKSSA